MLLYAMRTLSKTTSVFSTSQAMLQPTSSNQTLKMLTSKVLTWKTVAWFMQAKLTRTSTLPARLAFGACRCLAATVVWIFLTPHSQCWVKSFQLPTLVSKMCGASRAVSTLSTNLVAKNNAKNTFLASLLAKPCRWTWPNLMQVPTSNAWCSKPLSMKKTTAGAWTVWSVSSPTATLIFTWCSLALKKALRTVVACQCLSTTSVTAA